MSTRGHDGPAPLWRSTWLLVQLRLRALHNQISTTTLQKKKPGDKARKGNPGKRTSRLVYYFFGPMALLTFGSLVSGALTNLHAALDPPGAFWITVEFSTALSTGVAFLLAVYCLVALLLVLASGDLAKPQWDLEWLVTLPIRADTLLWSRILERCLSNPTSIIVLLPACTVVAWYSGHRWTAPLAGALATLPLLLLLALGRTLVDTGLRMSLRPAQLRNLSALISVLSLVVMYLGMSLSLGTKAGFMLDLARAAPEWLAWTPFGLTVRALNARDAGDVLLATLGLLAETAAILWTGVWLLRLQLRQGVISEGSREAARTPIAAASAEAPARSFLGPVQRRELALLARDRNFLVQSLVLPLLILGGQLLLGGSGFETSMWRNPDVLASVAFGLAAYTLSMSAFQTLNAEGHALWLLYTFPRSLDDVLKDKAKLWGGLSLAYPLVLFGIGLFTVPALDWKFFGNLFTALLGIPIYAFIAVALGVFGSNPLEQHQHHKVRPEYVYLFLSLAALYVFAIIAPSAGQRLVFMMLTLLLAFALWQKARDRLPYLLDPDVAPPARVSISDGLIAAMVFFVVQGVVIAIMAGGGRVTGAEVLVAFAIGGAVTYALMRYVYLRTKAEGVPRLRGDQGARPLTGLVAGAVAGVIGVAYLYGLHVTGLLEQAMRDSQNYQELGWWLLPLALLAAPLFEEFIFRGLIYGGLRRSFGVWPATLASAGLFAIVHPTVSFLPVFALGVCTAVAYERTRGLIAPMLAHLSYNAAVIAAQHWLY